MGNCIKGKKDSRTAHEKLSDLDEELLVLRRSAVDAEQKIRRLAHGMQTADANKRNLLRADCNATAQAVMATRQQIAKKELIRRTMEQMLTAVDDINETKAYGDTMKDFAGKLPKLKRKNVVSGYTAANETAEKYSDLQAAVAETLENTGDIHMEEYARPGTDSIDAFIEGVLRGDSELPSYVSLANGSGHSSGGRYTISDTDQENETESHSDRDALFSKDIVYS
jgi:hypothetical protein